MRTVLGVGVTIGAVLYALWIGSNAHTRGRANRSIRRAQRSAGASYGQLNSVTGRMPPVKIGLTLWFLLAVCAFLVYEIWFR